MRIKLLTQGNDGRRHVEAGEVYEEDGEWARRMLVNGAAEPLDDQAKKIAADPAQKERYGSEAIKSGLAGETAKVAKKK